MSLYRIVPGITGLSLLFSLLALPSSRSQDKVQYVQVKFACTTTINVTDTGVDTPDAYVCKNGKVTWVAKGHVFTVFFKNGCPFQSGCKEIDNQYPTAGPIKDTTNTTIYDYGIVIDGMLHDPHIIGGGN
ncbi:MAG TPA: hypothetical protein VKD70_18925 [Candidatus Acidoferrum sp.]|nr:hypothetical protein [Candidatus Acidoferrum sp.]